MSNRLDLKNPVLFQQEIFFLKNLVDELPFALFCKDYSEGVGRFIIWNKQSSKIWGLDEDFVVGKTDDDLLGKEQAEAIKSKDLHILTTGEHFSIAEEAYSMNGRKTKIRTWKVALYDNEKPRYILGLSQPVSETNSLENIIAEQTKKFVTKKLNINRAELIKQVVHEVNNPLAVLLGRMGQIKRQLDQNFDINELTDLVETTIAGIRKCSNRVNYLTTLLDDDITPQIIANTEAPIIDEKNTYNHELLNKLAIAQGRTNQAIRQVKSSNNTSPEALLEKLESSLNALKDIQNLILSHKDKKE